MNIFTSLKGVLVNMSKALSTGIGREKRDSVLGKRKLDYTYFGFISSTSRPPLSSPKLEKNSGVKKDERPQK